jgi:hypothetical protein
MMKKYLLNVQTMKSIAFDNIEIDKDLFFDLMYKYIYEEADLREKFEKLIEEEVKSIYANTVSESK